MKKVFFIVFIFMMFMIKAMNNTMPTADCNEETTMGNALFRSTLRHYFYPRASAIRDLVRLKKVPEDQLNSNEIEEFIEERGLRFGAVNLEDSIPVCLNNIQYLIIDKVGGGEEGEVYKIQDYDGNYFALKVYETTYKKEAENDLLIMKKAYQSRKYLNIPLFVNTHYGYSIFPLLAHRFKENSTNQNQWRQFRKELEHALHQDGLSLGDNLNESNYMYDAQGKLWRIDFGALKENK